MKIIFMGTPNFAVPILEALAKEHEVLMVVTQPDKRVGRKQILEESPVKILAKTLNIPIFQPTKLKEEYQTLLDLSADLIVTAAYGQMLPKPLLDRITALNVHGSLLPKYRGGAPIQYALFDAQKETGITIMYMAYKMDSGDIIKQGKVEITEADNYETLTKKLSLCGKDLLLEVLDEFKQGKPKGTPQNENEVTFAYNIKREEEFLNFNVDTKYVLGKIRGLSPNVGASINFKDLTIKVYDAKKSDIIKTNQPGKVHLSKTEMHIETLDGSIKILELQLPGKKKMDVRSFLNGQTVFADGDVVK